MDYSWTKNGTEVTYLWNDYAHNFLWVLLLEENAMWAV